MKSVILQNLLCHISVAFPGLLKNAQSVDLVIVDNADVETGKYIIPKNN